MRFLMTHAGTVFNRETVLNRVWGYNYYGQLGIGTTTQQLSPQPVTSSEFHEDGIIALTAGGSHTCALDISRSLFCWGSNLAGQVGIGTSDGPDGCSGRPPSACATSPPRVAVITCMP